MLATFNKHGLLTIRCLEEKNNYLIAQKQHQRANTGTQRSPNTSRSEIFSYWQCIFFEHLVSCSDKPRRQEWQ
jgi:hypothetical protein